MKTTLWSIYEKHGDILRYLIIGALTTLLDILFFSLLNGVLLLHYNLAKSITWIVTVTFAFFGNKWIVFRTKTEGSRQRALEALRFYASRLLTLLFSILFLSAFISLLGIDENLSNLLCNVFVIILNYVLGRWMVFRH